MMRRIFRNRPFMNIELNPRQQWIIGSALTALAVLALFAVLGLFARGLLGFLSFFSGVFMPLATAGVLSLLLRPAYQKIRERLKWPPIPSVLLIFTGILVPLVGITWAFGGLLLGQIRQLLRAAPDLVLHLRAWLIEQAPAINDLLEQVGGLDAVKDLLKTHAQPLLIALAGGAQGLFAVFGYLGGLARWAVLPVYMIFLLTAPPFRRDRLEDFLPFLRPGTRKDVVFLIQQFVDIVVTFFRGQVVIASLQGGLLALGFSAVGLSYGFLLGLCFGFLNIVPYLGNILGLAITLPLAWFQPDKGLGMVLAVLLVLAVVQAIEAYILTPRIMGKNTGLHPMVIIVAMFFWGKALGGIFGMVLAIPLTAFLVVFWRLAKDKYMREWV